MVLTSLRAEIRRLAREGAPAFTCPVAVQSVREVSASYARVTVGGAGLAAYRDVLPADAFKLMLPPGGHGTVDFPARGEDGLPYWPEGTRQPVLRAFTVRHFDPARLLLEFDVLRHEGLASAWSRAAHPGDTIGLAGIRHEFHAAEGVTRHVLVGDASALPAVSAIIASLPAGTPAAVYVGVAEESDEALLPCRDDVEVHCVRGGSPTGPDSPLAAAVRAAERPGGRIQAWLAAEAGVVRNLRRWAVDDLGVARDDLHAAAYWKAGLNSTDADALHLARYGAEVERGADAADPDTRERVELGT